MRWGEGRTIVRTDIRKQDAMLRALQINYAENETKRTFNCTQFAAKD